MSLLEVTQICKQQEESDQLIDISFTQDEFQKIAIAGATGSGKTTLLKIIAGLEQPDEGRVLFDGVRVKGPYEKLIPGHPRIAYLSQHFELRNHYRVEEILAMANLLSNMEANEIYKVCRIDHLLKRWTHQLSGGERQRISLARLLVTAPRLLVLDEPYSNLDAIHTTILKAVINDISEKLKITCLLVSHDPHDMLPWADEILVLQKGQLIQKGSPLKVYKEPVNEHAAALFGKYNMITGHLAQTFAGKGLDLNRCNGFIRPEDFKIVNDDSLGLQGEIRNILFMGGFFELEVNLGGSKIIMNSTNKTLKKGDAVFISLS